MPAKSTTYNLDVLPDATLAAPTASTVKFFEDTANGANSVGLKAASAIASDVTFTLPSADGTSGQALVTNGTGTLSFATVSTPGAVQNVEFTVGTAASTSSTTTIATGAVPVSVQLQITTAYTAGAAISIGYSGSTSFLMATTDNLPGTQGIYTVNLMGLSWTSNPVLVTITGSPAAGAARVRVLYTTTVNT